MGQKQESKHIIYLDVNDLYDYAMSKTNPTSEFRWIDPKEFDSKNIATIFQKVCFRSSS